MKKMLIALCAVCMAVLTQAASINWAAQTPLVGDYAALDTFAVVQAGSALTSAQAAALAIRGTAVADAQTLNRDDYLLSGGAPDVTVTKPEGTLALSDSISIDTVRANNYYIVLFDGGNINYAVFEIAAADAAAKWTEAPGLPGEIYQGDFETGKLAVPEPTALALLALGIAGLALRRRA